MCEKNFTKIVYTSRDTVWPMLKKNHSVYYTMYTVRKMKQTWKKQGRKYTRYIIQRVTRETDVRPR